MKKLKFAFAGLAVFTAVTTMSFTMTDNTAKTADPGDDCWSNPLEVGDITKLDRNSQTDCEGNNGTCCYQEGGVSYAFPTI